MEDDKGILLVRLLDKSEFYKAPASSREEFHGSYEGGLADHSLLVVRHMLELNEAWEAELDLGSIVKTGILHDIAKAGFDGQEYYKKKPNGKGYSYNKDLPSIGQNMMSCIIADRAGLKLTTDEYEAVMGQDGLFTNEGRSIFDTRSEPCKLSYIMHFSDWYVSAIHGI